MKMSVVILDTDPLIEVMVLDCVGESHTELEMVSETHAAKSFIESQDTSLIVVNADLPRGWRFCTELRRDQATAHIPLMILSGKATDEVFNEHQKLPTRADAYLKKPVMVDQFRLAILAVLKGEVMDVEIDVDLGIETPEITEVSVDDPGMSVPQSPEPLPPAPSVVTSEPVAPIVTPEPVAPSAGGDPFLLSDPSPASNPLEAIVPSEPQPPPVVTSGTIAPPVPAPAVAMPSVPAPAPPPPPSVQVDAASLTEISQERDLLRARVDELSQTGRALESAQTGQAQETEILRREVEALETERDVLEESRKRLSTDLDMSHQAQNNLKQDLENARQGSLASQGDEAGYIQQLEAHIDQLHSVFADMAQQASSADTELRSALATYQEREAALTQMRDSENRLTDTLLAVVEHVYEGLDLLRQDIHNGVPELPELGELPHPPEGVPAPFVRPDLPPRPSRAAGSTPNPISPDLNAEAPSPSPSIEGPTASIGETGAPSERSNAETILEGGEVPALADSPLRAPVESPTMALDELSDLEALIKPAPTTPTNDPSLNVAGAPLLDPDLMAELGTDPSQDHGGDIPFSAQDS